MFIDDDEILSDTFVDDYLLPLLELIICSSVFQRKFALSSKPYFISIISSIFALKTLDKTLDAWACVSLALVFEDNPLRHEKHLHLPYKLEDSFHVNKKTFETSMKQS
jgi:hypothetical protein